MKKKHRVKVFYRVRTASSRQQVVILYCFNLHGNLLQVRLRRLLELLLLKPLLLAPRSALELLLGLFK